MIHLLGIAPGKICAPAPVEEERVARDEGTMNMKALATRGVPWGVDEVDGERSDRHLFATVVRNELGCCNPCSSCDPRNFVLVDVDRKIVRREQFCNASDRMAHHRATDVVCVVMAHQNSCDSHVVAGCDVENLLCRVRGVDDHAFFRLAVTNEIDVVDHLGGEFVTPREVSSREELPEVHGTL